MAQAKKGDRVRIDFTGTLEDGTVFDTTREEAECSDDECGHSHGPMELTIGGEEFFPQIEEALVGMAPGERKTVTIPATDAFGEYDEEMVFTVGRGELPEDLVPEVGMELVLTGEEDESFEVTVIELDDENVTFDANHPLAGEDLTYSFELLEIL